MKWEKMEEIKGVGMRARTERGIYTWVLINHLTKEDIHNIYVSKNEVLGWIDVQDEIRPEVENVVHYLKKKGIKTILLSGDRYRSTEPSPKY